MALTPPPPPADEGVFYDAMWARYAHLDAVSPAAFHRRRLIVERAAAHAPDPRRLLDVGCGQGELLRDLAIRFPRAWVAGGDVSRRSLEDSRRVSPGADLFVLSLADDAFSRRHASLLASFDLVVCSEVFEHIADDHAAARRLVELVAPSGVAVVTVPGGAMSGFDRAIGHVRHYGDHDLAGLLEGAGLEVIEQLAWGFPFHSAYRAAVRFASRSLPAAGSRGAPTGSLPRALGAAYSLFGRAMKPLFYLNLARWGEQRIAVARRPPSQ
jgi:SAM-dependent methyltransferase